MGIDKVLGILILFLLIYIGLALGLPADTSTMTKYGLDANEARMMRFSTAIPLMIIWLIAYYGYSRFKKYAHLVKDSSEGNCWRELVKGLLVFVFWLPITSIISLLGPYLFHKDPSITPTVIIIQNYVNLIVVLIGFIFLFKGASRLLASLDKTMPDTFRHIGTALWVGVSGVFAYLTLISPNKQIPVDPLRPASYYLPDWLLVLTIIIPYIIVFYLGIRAVQNMIAYRKNVAGTIYKGSLRYLADGIGFIVVSLLAIRYLVALSASFSDATLKFILGLVYILILLIAAGYILIALGAKKLQRIEEV